MIKKGFNLNGLIDLVELFLYLVAIIIVTVLFRFNVGGCGVLYLIVDVCLLVTYYRFLKDIKLQNESLRIVKYSHGNIEAKFMKKISI